MAEPRPAVQENGRVGAGQHAGASSCAVRAADTTGDRCSTGPAGLLDADLETLRRRWRNLFGGSAPKHLSRPLLARILAYEMQVREHGDLCRATRRMLEAIAGSARESNAGKGTNRPMVPPPPELQPLLPGTELVREHEGALHRVMVLDEGFAWNGSVYPSLSKIALAITGTRWNGPRFFGLREKAGPPRCLEASP